MVGKAVLPQKERTRVATVLAVLSTWAKEIAGDDNSRMSFSCLKILEIDRAHEQSKRFECDALIRVFEISCVHGV